MTDTNSFPVWVPALFITMWFVILGTLSFVGGWHQLASRFRASASIDGEKFWFAGMSLGNGPFPVSYGNCLFITIGHAGIRISISLLFRFLHPPLLIPWSEIEVVRPEKFWFLTFTAMRVRGFDKRILFTKRVGNKLFERFNSQHSANLA